MKNLWTLVVIFLCLWSGVAYGEVHRYELVGNGRDRGMYDAGIFLEALTRIELQSSRGFYVETRFTEGDGESLEGLLRERSGFGLVKGTSLWNFIQGEGGVLDGVLFETLKDEVKVIAVLWREVLHGLIRKDRVQSGTLSDLRALKGDRIVVGGGGGGGLDVRGWVFPFLGLSDEGEGGGGVDVLGEDWESEADGVVWVSGVPSDVVGRLMKSGEWYFLDTTWSQGVDVKIGSGGTWQLGRLGSDFYSGMEGGREVLSQLVYLVALKGVSSEDVYRLTKTIFEKRCYLEGMSGVFHALLSPAEQMAVRERLWDWHEGSRRYYEERREGGGEEESCG